MVGIVLAALGGSFLLSCALTALARRWARYAGFVDRPGGHKGHREPVALGGGIAIFLASCSPVLAGTLVASLVDPSAVYAWLPQMLQPHVAGVASKLPMVSAIVLGALVLHVVGLIDDCKPLGPWAKVAVQVIVALFVAGIAGVRAAEALPAPLSILITVVWIVLITNAFNFLDNMDGLSAGVAAVAAAIFAIAAAGAGQIFVPVMAWILVGTLLGYLLFNFPPATIFMGDSGSLVIGYLLAVLTILTTYYDPEEGTRPYGLLMPFVVLAVPLYDVGSVVVHRLRVGESPFRGDQRHFSHRLVKRGLTPRMAVITIYLATAATGLPAVLLPRVNWTIGLLILLECLCVVAMIAILEHIPGKHTANGTSDRIGHG
jgi:UDP-GlcNAc:undecaprenyl-phosphate GlcNAc-1-phosphate transferase